MAAPTRAPDRQAAHELGDARSSSGPASPPVSRSSSDPRSLTGPAFRFVGSAEDRDDRDEPDADPGHGRRRDDPEVAEDEQVQAEPGAERVAGPRAEERRDQQQRQLAAGGAADQDVERGVEDADEQGEDRGRPIIRRSPGARRARGGRLMIRPPPTTTSPS